MNGFFINLLSLLLALVLVRATQDEYCTDLSHCEPHVSFPFRFGDNQPSKCGYPGFNLSCTVRNETVFELPNTPIKLFVTKIDYYWQEMAVKVPDYYRSSEVRRSLEFLDLSKTTFRFSSRFSSFVLMKCSGRRPSIYSEFMARCTNYEDNYRYTYDSRDDGLINSDIRVITSSRHKFTSDLFNCTKMYSFRAPLHPQKYHYFSGDDCYFSLTWSIPSCETCDQQYKGCRLKKNTLNHETECYNYEQNREGPIQSIVTAVSTVGSFLVLFTVVVALYVYTSDKMEKENRQRIEKFLEDYTAFKPSRYTYADIKKITDQFKIKLGQGAYGTVFKGKLSNEIFVAVKILSNITKGDGGDFVNEVSTMGRIHHVNVSRLVGYCADGYRRALVYEFFPNYSLDKYISSKSKLSLSWERLRAIALGIAKGIDYLHQGCDQRILHFDIKPHNILLDQNFTPKICDFGLAKLCSKDQSIVSMTTTRGTMGYIAPEVFSRNFGNVSCKSDVYSFGMLLLEMVGGRKNTSESTVTEEIYYPEWIYNLIKEGEDLRIQIEEEGDAIIAKRLAIVGLWCIQWHPIGRPSMKVVVQMLEGSEDLIMPPNPFISTSSNSAMSNNIIPVRRVAFELEPIAE